MAGANILTEANGTVRRCLMCRVQSLENRLRRHHKARPPDSGLCMAGLHEWTPANQLDRGDGTFRCRPCAQAAQRRFYAGKHYVSCVVAGCERATYRSDDSTYVCRTHRAQPPAWFARLGMRIQGTRLVTSQGWPKPPQTTT